LQDLKDLAEEVDAAVYFSHISCESLMSCSSIPIFDLIAFSQNVGALVQKKQIVDEFI
jgi:hypothetical protein